MNKGVSNDISETQAMESNVKRDFSFYEFAGIIVPSVILLYSANLVWTYVHHASLVNYNSTGEIAVLLVVSYAVGHLMQSLGNLFEKLVWWICKGMPSRWLSNKNIFGNTLFKPEENERILDIVQKEYGESYEDYGRIVHNYVSQHGKTDRIDVFNTNYSLFRGLSTAMLLIVIMCAIWVNEWYALSAGLAFILALLRMIRFAKYYATEVYRSYYNLKRSKDNVQS